ncbi:hypothetical protein [Flavilitoribacter nigricans]|uniref:YtkA-like domain-containing protein n=1 Tax=Flavilitoribacter nigricans (strain ATCC 23147 / DSM 23189 / NBRC 102662 / NCIMB 1420 / SS-2) TaxID=1122177 RepID=A0A2D0N2T9_FLAN2|nr:hypothetical protein [Flavilitoribacter nigricans]PHN02708.1 hypothetical protein CRP01_30460 [Flavilitoribacter nigricans DSM 23189 = NBRC 102662]
MRTVWRSVFFLVLLVFVACKKEEDEPMTTDYHYHAHILQPNADDKQVDDSLHIHVEFESHTGETVHHVNVRIYNKNDNTEIYSKPADAHVHETSGVYEFQDDFTLSEANGVTAHSDWILEASVWGHDNREGEMIEQVEFHVHPK